MDAPARARLGRHRSGARRDLPNTIDEARFAIGPRPDYLAARYKLTAGEKVVLTVARLDLNEGYKGYDRIVEALPVIRRACGPVRFVIAGA
jgi:glycosyltransferase involved in cell wall biosynthesis